MVFCPYCGQQFTRDEHLERHILTHTNVKPFRCLTCHMSFARRDLLQRHYTVHGRDQNQQEIPAANGMMPKSAGRTPIACVNCAKTKTRCDKKFPCSRCASKNLECTLRSTRRTTKNAQRMELPPDGTVAAPPYTTGKHSLDSASTGIANIQGHKPSSPDEPAPASRSEFSWYREKVSQQGQPTHQPYHSMPVPQQSTADANAGLPDVHSKTYQQNLAFPAADEFGSFGDASNGGASPHFMIDWHQLQVPMDFNPLSQPSMTLSTDMNMDYNAYGFDAGPDAMLPMLPDHNGILLTPIESPQNSHCPELGLYATPSYQAQHPRSVSNASTVMTHSETVTETSAIDSWSVFRCSPTIPSSNCPKTALLNLELLEKSLCNHKTWLDWRPGVQQPDSSTTSDHLTVMHLHESTRDKLLAITQSFLHKALEIHRDGSAQFHQQQGGLLSPRSHSGSSFVLLPPGRVLECFLRSYSNSFERYFPLSPRGILDVNELMHCQHDRAASVLVLMMIAQGASNLPSPEARILTGGLIEACRISLFDMVERNITMSGDTFVLRAALLFTVQAAWSGDKWQMDIAMGQRGMYLAMLRQAGMLEPTASASSTQQNRDGHRLWSDWIQEESRSRLVYSWAMADQELALLHDTAPLINVNELNPPMPDADRLWRAQSASEWSSVFENVHAFAGGHSSLGSGARPLSLRALFMRFLDGDMASLGQHMTPLQLRLLLLPLQSLVHQQAQLISCLSSKSGSPDEAASMFNANSAQSKMGDIQRLLQQWYDLAQQYLDANSSCAVMQASLTLFHLISLNTVTNFGEIESLARREDFNGSDQQLQWRHSRCIQDVEMAVFHCGQMLRHIKGMNKTTRPAWWAGAVYRAGLVLWADSLLAKQATPQNVNGICSVPGPSLTIDSLRPDHALIARYLTKREGVPCVTKQDGSQMNVDNAFNVLQHCVQLIDDGNTTRLTDGIRSKLDRLSKR